MKSLFKIAQSHGYARTGTTKPDELSYNLCKSGTAKAAMFCIGEKLAKTMRWIVGDRIDVLYDQEMAEGQLVRCANGGWALTGKNADGPKRVRISLKPEFGLPDVGQRIDLAVEVTDNTICFAFPTQYRKPVEVKPKTS